MTGNYRSAPQGYEASARAKPRRRVLRRTLYAGCGIVAVIGVAFVALMLWPNPTVPADQPNMTPVMTGTNNDWLSFDDFVPGTAIAADGPDNDEYECTLAFLGRDGSGAPIGYTAGHCDRANDNGRPHFTRKSDEDTPIDLGQFTTAQTADTPDKVVETGSDGWSDFAVIDIDPALADSVEGNARIAGVYQVTKVLDHEYLLNNDVTLCKFGFVSGETCGKVLEHNSVSIEAELYSAAGDSGSPAYVKLGNDQVAAVGILRGSPEGEDNHTEFSLFAPILKATGASLFCSDPTCRGN
ncbi:S1 family peptidase [Mycolicibacterium mageritense]|uniref:S1 family peptidase n=1 Tax=Mycolicibacterium mageritense TaxID=53462 RepID=UPI001E5BBD40|nr:S1 family peptidase [Mycolicibacterium mageritense]GJJ17850.1 trypsin [Mycolicibacterium mageritense]